MRGVDFLAVEERVGRLLAAYSLSSCRIFVTFNVVPVQYTMFPTELNSMFRGDYVGTAEAYPLSFIRCRAMG